MDQAEPNSRNATPGLYNWLGVRVKRFIRWWRGFDAWVNKPLREKRSLYWSLLAPDGYPWFVPLLAALLIGIMALGPTVRTGSSNIAMLILGLALLFGLHAGAKWKRSLQQYLLAGQLTILGVLALLVVIFSAPETYGDPSGSLRLHVGVAVAIVMIIALCAVWWIARQFFRLGGNQNFVNVLPQVELFGPNDRYEFAGKSPIAEIFSALLVVPVRYPVELLLPGSLLVLFLPDGYLVPTFFIVGAVTWFALFLGILFERLTEVLKTIGRLFFVGPQRGISVVVVVVAILRLLGVHYIAYLFNAGSITIMLYVACTYVAAWYYAYWSDQFVARRLIRLLAPTQSSSATVAPIPYPFHGNQKLSPVEAEGRSIALHGAGRLKIEGVYKQGYDTAGRALAFMTPAELLACFRTQVEQNDKTKAGAADPLPNIRHLQRSATVYPVVTGTLAFLLLAAPAFTAFEYSVQPPELLVQQAGSTESIEPSSLLFGNQPTGECAPLGPNDPRIAVIASGGGTRAAIYTASVLRGLAEQGRICNVVLVSGVSGGSAALGYFAIHERELRKPGKIDDAGKKAWQKFSETMAMPYIEYALDGASDLRVTFGRYSWQQAACGEQKTEPTPVKGWRPARSRLGNILGESFVCVMGPGVMADPSFGVMLNTSLLGSFDTTKTCDAGKDLPLPEAAAACSDALDGTTAGGRLVLTNLAIDTPDAGDGTPKMQIKPIIDGGMSIARAAALSANFPPVFSDAAIDVMSGENTGVRYWVTDGGAVENRGAMTLYVAVRKAVKSVSAADVPPPLHIVIADVSAAPGNYTESFGLNSVLAAGGQLGLGMEGEVFSDIRDLYCTHHSTVVVHDIIMPPVLRNGGIGTHWLLPGSLMFQGPKGTDPETLSAHDIMQVVLALHSDNPPAFDDEAANTVLDWARSGNDHDKNWHDMLNKLSNPVPGEGCATRGEGGTYTAK